MIGKTEVHAGQDHLAGMLNISQFCRIFDTWALFSTLHRTTLPSRAAETRKRPFLDQAIPVTQTLQCSGVCRLDQAEENLGRAVVLMLKYAYTSKYHI